VAIRALLIVCLLAACGTLGTASAPSTPSPSPLGECGTYPPPPLQVDATIQHLKTSATVVEVTSSCTVRVRISGGMNELATFTNRVIVLRAMSRTTYATAAEGDLGAIGRFGLKAGDAFTLSFDSRPFADGSYPLNFMNR
jgi:hypothetical protein